LFRVFATTHIVQASINLAAIVVITIHPKVCHDPWC